MTNLFGLDPRMFNESKMGFDGSRGEGTPANETEVEGVEPTGEIDIAKWPAMGMHQPSDFACFVDSATVPICITANAGTSRSYGPYVELAPLSSLPLNLTLFPEGIQNITQLGELRVSTLNSDTDDDGFVDTLWVPGSRSFSVLDMQARSQLFESGDSIEKLLSDSEEDNLKSLADVNDSFDQSSIFSGCEPNAVATGSIDSFAFSSPPLLLRFGFPVGWLSDTIRLTR